MRPYNFRAADTPKLCPLERATIFLLDRGGTLVPRITAHDLTSAVGRLRQTSFHISHDILDQLLKSQE